MHRQLPAPAAADRVEHGSISAQARRLHGLGSTAATIAGSRGLLGRAQAERLAERCNARIEELVEAGLWDEHDRAYVINALAV